MNNTITEKEARVRINRMFIEWHGPLYIQVSYSRTGGSREEFIALHPDCIINLLDCLKECDRVDFAVISFEDFDQTLCGKTLLDRCWNNPNECNEWGIALTEEGYGSHLWRISWIDSIIGFIKDNMGKSALFLKKDPSSLEYTRFYMGDKKGAY